jgi:hypothetical protein
MNLKALSLIAVLSCFGAAASQAATFTPTFDTPAFPGTQYDVTATENAYYAENYGITVDNAYLYLDDRDTFDGVGIANSTVAEIGTPQTATITFLDTTDYVTIDYLAILDGVYEAYDSMGTLIDSFAVDGTLSVDGVTGTETLSGGIISYITFTSLGGYITVSGLTYNYDGTTDGVNDDIAPVPLPATGLLLLGGLAALRLRRRRA